MFSNLLILNNKIIKHVIKTINVDNICEKINPVKPIHKYHHSLAESLINEYMPNTTKGIKIKANTSPTAALTYKSQIL